MVDSCGSTEDRSKSELATSIVVVLSDSPAYGCRTFRIYTLDRRWARRAGAPFEAAEALSLVESTLADIQQTQELAELAGSSGHPTVQYQPPATPSPGFDTPTPKPDRRCRFDYTEVCGSALRLAMDRLSSSGVSPLSQGEL